MDIICQSCSTRLSIPDDRLPKNVPSVTGKCPNCQSAIEIRLDGGPIQAPPEAAPPPPAPAASPAPAAAAAPPPAPPAAPPPAAASAPPAPEAAQAACAPASPPRARPAPEPSAPMEVDEFIEGRRLALVCVDGGLQAQVKDALEPLGYTVHAAARPQDGIQRLRRNKYEVLVLHEAFGGSAQENLVLGALQPMAMGLRRHMCVGLLGPGFNTLDNMTAFAKSVNFVVSERDLGKLGAIVKQAVLDNDQFYHVFREAMREAGKA